jgi:integrase
MKWCVKKGWVDANAFEKIEGVGRRRHGKAQLRIDEARAWMSRAVSYAEAGEPGAVMAMMALLMGLRASEICNRVVRDVDDGGKLLWIPASKTEAGRRTQQVPEVLRPFLLALCKGKSSNDRLFGDRWRDYPRRWVKRICRECKLPEVTAHGMRRLHSTLAVDSGITAHAVASALGHESFTTTAQSYAKPEALTKARQTRVLQVLAGGVA